MSKFKYIVIYDCYGERGWSSNNEYYTRFEILEEAKNFYNSLELEEVDFGVYYKKIYEIKKVDLK